MQKFLCADLFYHSNKHIKKEFLTVAVIHGSSPLGAGFRSGRTRLALDRVGLAAVTFNGAISALVVVSIDEGTSWAITCGKNEEKDGELVVLNEM